MPGAVRSRVRQHPGAAEVLDVADGALALLRQLRPAALQPPVQLVEPVLGLLEVGLPGRARRAGLPLLHQLGHTAASAGRSARSG